MSIATYRNLDLQVSDYRKADTGSAYFRVQVIDSPAGEQASAEEVELPNLGQRLRQLDKRALSLDQMIELGTNLGSMLFPPGVRGLLERSRARLKDSEVLRIRLRLNTYALANIPWEYAYVLPSDAPAGYRGTDGFLVLDRRISFVRYEAQGQPPGNLDPVGTGPLRMVTLFANPKSPEFADLKLDVEQQNMEQALKDLAAIKPEFYPDTTLEILQDALAIGAHVFHFAGHGKFEGDLGATFGSIEGKGYVILQSANQAPRQYAAEHLARRLTGNHVRLAFLGACEGGRRDQVNPWTGVVPAITRAGIPAVLGMQYTIIDRNAIIFSRRFYRALVAGQSIDAAVTDGRLAILEDSSSQNERDWGVPVLYLRADEGVLFPRPSILPDPAREPIRKPEAVDEVALRHAMNQAFDLNSLDLMWNDIQAQLKAAGVPDVAESLEGVVSREKPKANIILAVIDYVKQRGQIDILVDAVRHARPNII